MGAEQKDGRHPVPNGREARLAGGGFFEFPGSSNRVTSCSLGETGSGKSNAIRQVLRQVEDRGETAILYDPTNEFVQEFYRPERGDYILNPLDARCPFWNPEWRAGQP